MEWNLLFPKGFQPELSDIEKHINNPLWQKLCAHIETTYGVKPRIEHSTCSGAPGWNVKYKKSGRALCTLYPHQGFFTALVCIGIKEQMEAELLLCNCCEYLQELYRNAKPFNGSRWLMIDITDENTLEVAIQLIGTRAKKQGEK